MSRHISHGQSPFTQEDFDLGSIKPETAVWSGCQCAHGTKVCHFIASSTVPKGCPRSAKERLDLRFALSCLLTRSTDLHSRGRKCANQLLSSRYWTFQGKAAAQQYKLNRESPRLILGVQQYATGGGRAWSKAIVMSCISLRQRNAQGPTRTF